MPEPSAKPGVIFDMDGVIVHSNPVHKKAIEIFCEKYDKDVSDSVLEQKIFGRTNKEWIPELFGDISTEEIEELAAAKEQLFREMFSPPENVVKGLHSFLENLKSNNIPAAVATSAPVENADFILSSLSIRDYFKAVLDSSHVDAGKPDPDIYLKAAGALGKHPENCFIFEDSVSGVKAGLNAGSVVIGVTTTHSREELADCHLIIENFEALNIKQLVNKKIVWLSYNLYKMKVRNLPGEIE